MMKCMRGCDWWCTILCCADAPDQFRIHFALITFMKHTVSLSEMPWMPSSYHTSKIATESSSAIPIQARSTQRKRQRTGGGVGGVDDEGVAGGHDALHEHRHSQPLEVEVHLHTSETQ